MQFISSFKSFVFHFVLNFKFSLYFSLRTDTIIFTVNWNAYTFFSFLNSTSTHYRYESFIDFSSDKLSNKFFDIIQSICCPTSHMHSLKIHFRFWFHAHTTICMYHRLKWSTRFPIRWKWEIIVCSNNNNKYSRFSHMCRLINIEIKFLVSLYLQRLREHFKIFICILFHWMSFLCIRINNFFSKSPLKLNLISILHNMFCMLQTTHWLHWKNRIDAL